MVTGSNVEAFQGVEATGNMAPKTGDSPLRKHQQSTEKKERIVTATIHFEEVKAASVHFAFRLFRQRNSKFSSVIPKLLLLFSLERYLIMVLLKNDHFREKG